MGLYTLIFEKNVFKNITSFSKKMGLLTYFGKTLVAHGPLSELPSV